MKINIKCILLLVFASILHATGGANNTSTQSLPENTKEGDSAENPVYLGSIAQPYKKIVSFDTREFNDCYAGSYSSGRKDVYLKFSFPYDVEFALSPDDAKVNGAFVSLLNSNLRQVRLITTNAYPNTSLYESRLAAGTYYVVLEGAGMDGELGADIRILPLNNLADTQWRPTTNMNYVVTMSPTYETSNSANVSPRQSNTTIKYYDYLGRPSQTKQYAASPNGQDITSQQDYNVYGVVSKSYLPVDLGNNGEFIAASGIQARGAALYEDINPYQLTNYDDTPLMRVKEQYGPGQEWQGPGIAIKSNYDLNADSVTCFGVSGTRTNPKLIRKPAYASKSLYVATITDEDGHLVHKYSDKNGQNILTRVEAGAELLDTYSVYDDFGNLCFVLPPMIQPGDTSTENLKKYAFMYRYDYRNRCIGKKIPGAEWAYYVYDYADNLIFSQDGESRSRKEWNCTLPDKFKRPVISGVYKGAVNRESIYKQVITAVFDNTGTYGYSFTGLNADSLDVLTATYYDNYDFKNKISGFGPDLEFDGDEEYGYWHNHYAYNAKGLVTGSITAVLDENKRTCTTTFYDADKRPIQVRMSTPEGGLSVKKSQYDFVGNVVKSYTTERPTSAAHTDELVRHDEYDKTGRLLRTETTLNGGAPAVVRYEYDGIGRLVATIQGEGATAIRTEKKYNIRGWLTEQNNDLFSMKLEYLHPKFSAPSYSGNIMEWSWKHANQEVENTYAFTYDVLSRLTGTHQYEDSRQTDRNVEQGMTYDRNGNLLSLSRSADGQTESSYLYSYNGNQLHSLAAPSANSSRAALALIRPEKDIPAKLKPLDPEGPLHPIDPNPPVDPVWPKDPIKPIWPEDPVIPVLPDEPLIPTWPDYPHKPILRDSLITRPERPLKPTWPDIPFKPINPDLFDPNLPFIAPDTLYTGDVFRYDYNGNMVYDALRNRNMRYNRLNLLQKVFDQSATYANYRYLSDGTKLSVLDDDGNGLLYQGSLVYQKQGDVLTLESASVAGGRIVASQTSTGVTYAPQYYISDHLGSTRAVTDGTAANTTSYDYYPFGKQWTNADVQLTDNRYLFNGKEWQPTGNVNLLDYGARMYDPELGIWRNVDPKTNLYTTISPYAYCLNNPLKYADAGGENPIVVVGGLALTVVDLALIATGVVTTGVILQKSQQDGSLEFTSSMRSLFKSNPGWDHQQGEDRRGQNALNQAQANVQKSINDNFPDPNDYDPNKGPEFRRGGKKTKAFLACLALISQIGSDKNSVISILHWYNILFGEDEDDNNETTLGNAEEQKSDDEQDKSPENLDTKPKNDSAMEINKSKFYTNYREYLEQNFNSNSHH